MLQEEELKSAVLMVLANKQDIPSCLSLADVHRSLGLDALRTRTFQIFKTSATKGEGLDEAMEWYVSFLFGTETSKHKLSSSYQCKYFETLWQIKYCFKSSCRLSNNLQQRK